MKRFQICENYMEEWQTDDIAEAREFTKKMRKEKPENHYFFYDNHEVGGLIVLANYISNINTYRYELLRTNNHKQISGTLLGISNLQILFKNVLQDKLKLVMRLNNGHRILILANIYTYRLMREYKCSYKVARRIGFDHAKFKLK